MGRPAALGPGALVVARAAVLLSLAALAASAPAHAETALPGGRALVATASVSPSTHLFGDAVVATVDVVLDPAQFDPDRLDVTLRFAPYEALAPVRTTRRDVGDLVHLHYEAALRCLHINCIAPRFETILGEQEAGRAERHSIRLPPVRIAYAEPGGAPAPLLTRRFPVVEVVSRINTARFQGLEPDARPGSEGAFVASLQPPEPTYRARPPLVAALALGAAVLLALLPAILVGRSLVRRWQARRTRAPLSPLERALALVDWSATRGDVDDRRKALEALAAALDDGGALSIAHRTRELAWAEPSPAGEQAGEAGAEARALAKGNGRAS